MTKPEEEREEEMVSLKFHVALHRDNHALWQKLERFKFLQFCMHVEREVSKEMKDPPWQLSYMHLASN